MADAELTNLSRLYAFRYKEAHSLFNTDRHDDCVAILTEMAEDEYLTLWFRLQVHNLLAAAVMEVPDARSHLAKAEAAAAEVEERWPRGTPGQEKMYAQMDLFYKHFEKVRQELDEIDAEADAAEANTENTQAHAHDSQTRSLNPLDSDVAMESEEDLYNVKPPKQVKDGPQSPDASQQTVTSPERPMSDVFEPPAIQVDTAPATPSGSTQNAAEDPLGQASGLLQSPERAMSDTAEAQANPFDDGPTSPQTPTRRILTPISPSLAKTPTQRVRTQYSLPVLPSSSPLAGPSQTAGTKRSPSPEDGDLPGSASPTKKR